MRSSLFRRTVVVLFLVASVFSQARSEEFARHLASGEFASARSIASLASPNQRDGLMGQLASSQRSSGDSIAAAQTLRNVGNAYEIDSAINEGAAGGSAFADFGSLMSLIETTVVPDTWEALGGPSTMAPYPQGVFVDPAGTVQPCETVRGQDQWDDLQVALDNANGNSTRSWRSPSDLRVVSLRRLRDEITQQRLLGRPISESMLNLGGLSQIQYVVIDQSDIYLAGPVGGVERVNGWYRDQATGMNTLRSDFLSTCLASALQNQHFGCTIDPTPEGMQRAAEVARDVQSNAIPVGKAAEKMASALGMQRVEVFGKPGDTPIGYVMVEADRHMKQLALGEAEMPDGVKNYLDIIDDFIDQGTPNQLLLRLWFTASPRKVRTDGNRRVFEISGNPIQLSGENQRALADGRRGQVTVDPRSKAFVAEFNDHWTEIREKYPIYSSLESVYRVASVSEILHRHAQTREHHDLLESLALEASRSDWIMPTPRQVASIATHHSVRHERKIHHVVLASGGVSVKSDATILSQPTVYPGLKDMATVGSDQPKLVQSWWWNGLDLKQ